SPTGTPAITSTGGPNTLTGPVTFDGPQSPDYGSLIRVDGDAPLTVAGGMQGAGNVIKQGDGLLLLTGDTPSALTAFLAVAAGEVRGAGGPGVATIGGPPPPPTPSGVATLT